MVTLNLFSWFLIFNIFFLSKMVKDELQALQLAYTALEGKHRKVQEENQELVGGLFFG